MKDKADSSTADRCPIREESCPRGPEAVEECQLRFTADFNPMLNFHDFGLMQCAVEQAEKRTGR
jgi:hypothetical protein